MLLDRRNFFVKERVAFVKLTDTYDIMDPESGVPIGVAKEEPPAWAIYLRLVLNKHFLPTAVNIYEDEAAGPLFTLKKSLSFLRARVVVEDARGKPFGHFESKLFSLGGGFFVVDDLGNRVAEVKGDWKGWNFRFLDSGGQEIGLVTKKWAGFGKELFTSADNYIITLSEAAPKGPQAAALLLAAGLAIDIVFKEGKG